MDTNEKKMKAQASRRKYDEENMGIISTKLRKEDVAAFRARADREGKTVSRALADCVRASIQDDTQEPKPTGTNAAVLTYKNVERLKHEVAFHNPQHLNPDKMLNHILNRYFEFVEEVRQTSR